MNTVSNPLVAGSPPAGSGGIVKRAGLIAALAALVAIVWMPTPHGLPPAGQVMLGILAFAVIVWMTEALDYAVSAVVIGALMVLLLAYAPDAAKPSGVDMGTGAALGLALSGFSNSAVALVAAACFIAAAMTATGLDRRIALVVLSRVDARTNHIVIGAMVVGFLLSFIVPSTTARVACLVPIMMGFILAFKVEKRSRFAGLLVITAAQTASIWNVGIKTAAAQNMVAASFIEKQFQTTISWTEWFVAGAPFSALLSVALYFIMTRMMRPEMKEIAGGKATIRKQLDAIGAMTSKEWKLLVIVLVLLGFWASEKALHDFDTASTTIAAIALMMLPRLGVMDWKESQRGFPWGTVVLFAVGISVGTALLRTQAAGWLADLIVQNLGLRQASAFAILMLLSLFLIVIHLGFASATALASTMIPIVISVLTAVQTPGINVVGMTMLLQFVVSFGFILPVNAPQNMIAYGTDTFEARDFIRTGLVITLAATVLLVVLALTYWPWRGYMTKAA
ncbi:MULTISPECIES: DASS family sodium-coupled anion symporter [unclassified Variovorax]|uniref:SLC13 family permease n=1 Tax=unclassified Variovorax TaxID=663243 RepID=UPI0008387B16|nr:MULTISPECIES: DASS family sodium-coupled anion symporter [unclassified Variovorax]PNG48736.1 Citrate carrier [Variovorax sp. B2]PNG49669.1 Citrate carrier [Variovorax sp. B4]VTV18647.1 Citrate/succinate antiporter [Variovorax sp. WDL1]